MFYSADPSPSRLDVSYSSRYPLACNKDELVKMAKDKSEKRISRLMNSAITGIDLGDNTSLAAVLSPTGDVSDRFSFRRCYPSPTDSRLPFKGI